MTDITVTKRDEVYLSIAVQEESVARELGEYFSFHPPNYQYSPSFTGKKWNPRTRKYDRVHRYWDGKIRLYNRGRGTLYLGLLSHLEHFCKENNYSLDVQLNEAASEFSQKEALDFIEGLNLPKEINGKPLIVQPEQVKAFIAAVRDRRRLILYPTGGGKSLIIYFILRYFDTKTLIVVPTTTLVHQLAGDFKDYGYKSEVHKIMEGNSPISDSPISVGTWQSLYKLKANYFNDFGLLIGDEAHLFQADSLTKLMAKTTNIPVKIGLTATIQDTPVHKLTLEGVFGPVKTLVKTKDLMDRKFLADLKVKIITLAYPDDVRKAVSKAGYRGEVEYIVSSSKRNNFITNLALSLDGNSMILFHFVDKHGRILYDLITKNAGNREVFFIHGGVESEERDNIRRIVDKQKNAIIVASYGTFSTGINMPNLHNLIFATSFKSKIRNMQSIGRGLRKTATKDKCTLFDLCDDFTYNGKANYSVKHLKERIEIYNQEQFDYKLYTVSLT